jgi:hypothetical protein
VTRDGGCLFASSPAVGPVYLFFGLGLAKIAAFREWLLAEAADDPHHLAALGYTEVTAPAV